MQQLITVNQNRLGTTLMYEIMPICSGGCTTQQQTKDTRLDLLSYGCRLVHGRCCKSGTYCIALLKYMYCSNYLNICFWGSLALK